MTHEHPLIQFWVGAYAQMSTVHKYGISFCHPLFKDPLMSPNFLTSPIHEFVKESSKFAHLNCISSDSIESENIANFRIVKRFFLGTVKIESPKMKPKLECDVMPLHQATHLPEFFELLRDGFPHDIEFLKRMIFELPASNAHYYCLTIKQSEKILGFLNIGIFGSISLIFNTVIREEFRNQSLSNELFAHAKIFLKSKNVKQAVFWTNHQGLVKQAHSVDCYTIYSKIQEV
jgi:hypothetical protein